MRLDNSKRNLSLLGLVLSLTVTLPTFAQESGANSTQAARPVEGQQQPANQDPLASLQLTGEQRAAIRAIRITSRDEQAALTQKLRRTNRAIEEALDAEEPSGALIEQRVKEFGEAHAALRRLMVNRELRIRRVLTAEQRATLRDLVHQAQITQDSGKIRTTRSNRPRQITILRLAESDTQWYPRRPRWNQPPILSEQSRLSVGRLLLNALVTASCVVLSSIRFALSRIRRRNNHVLRMIGRSFNASKAIGFHRHLSGPGQPNKSLLVYVRVRLRSGIDAL